MVWRDENGKALTDFPRPSVAVDVAVLTVRGGDLHVVVADSARDPALPGTFLRPGETLTLAAERALRSKVAIVGLRFHQLRMFDAPARDDRGWVLSMAHGAAISTESLSAATESIRVSDLRPSAELAFDHGAMVGDAVLDLRARYAREIDPAALLPQEFTLLELRALYEVVFARPMLKDTFRRHVITALEGTGTTTTAGGGRPAELYRRSSSVSLPPSAASFLHG